MKMAGQVYSHSDVVMRIDSDERYLAVQKTVGIKKASTASLRQFLCHLSFSKSYIRLNKTGFLFLQVCYFMAIWEETARSLN
jgi:hypothetical protein